MFKKQRRAFTHILGDAKCQFKTRLKKTGLSVNPWLHLASLRATGPYNKYSHAGRLKDWQVSWIMRVCNSDSGNNIYRKIDQNKKYHIKSTAIKRFRHVTRETVATWLAEMGRSKSNLHPDRHEKRRTMSNIQNSEQRQRVTGRRTARITSRY